MEPSKTSVMGPCVSVTLCIVVGIDRPILDFLGGYRY